MDTQRLPAAAKTSDAEQVRPVRPVADTEYAYAAGRIRALQTGLMDTNRTVRLTEAADTAEFIRYLTDAGYPVADTAGLSLIGRFIDAAELARALAPEPAYVTWFHTRADVRNAKMFLKHTVGQETVPFEGLDRRINKPSLIPPRALYEAIRDWDRSRADIPDWLWDAIREAYTRYTESGDGARIDQTLETALAKEAARLADALGNAWFSRLLRMRIDLTNLETAFRQLRSGVSKEFAAEALLPGGMVPEAEVQERLGRDPDDLAQAWAGTPYLTLALSAARDYATVGGPARFGKQADDFVMHHVRTAHRVPFGPEILVGYVYAVDTEVRNARMILTFLRNRLDPAGARDLLRETYVES